MLCLSVWGPQPLAWLWIGSQADYWLGSHMGGIVVAFAGHPRVAVHHAVAGSRLDRLWRIVRRAAGHDQREGALPRIFGASAVIALVRVRVLVPGDPGPRAVALAGLMRQLFGYYRQFDELSPDEVSRELLARRDEERRRHPARSRRWTSRARPGTAAARRGVNAATFALRRAVNAYPDAAPLRAAIAAVARHRSGAGDDRPRRRRADPRGAAGGAATGRSRSSGRAGGCSRSWSTRRARRRCPSRRRRRAHGGAVPAQRSDRRGRRRRAGDALADPRRGAGRVRRREAILDHPRVIQVRSFSKGTRWRACGSATRSSRTAGRTSPGRWAWARPALAGALWAVESGAESARRRREQADASGRGWRRSPVAAGVGPYAWLALPVAEELAARRIYVAPGTAWGDERHVRSRCRRGRDRPAARARCAELWRRHALGDLTS